MKLAIHIPAWNEESTIETAIRSLPRRLRGFSEVLIFVVDDGSTDRTAEIAEEAGATVVRLLNHQGLSAAFRKGIDAALAAGADVIVNTDADNQYEAQDIEALVAPILDGRADVVIGDRVIARSPHMGPLKRFLQSLGSRAVSIASGISLPDVTSGFRAFSREAAMRLNVFNSFTYTLETIIQAGHHNLEVRAVPVRTNAPVRPSRLYGSIFSYLWRSVLTIFRVYTLYRPLRTFLWIGALLFLGGALIGGRFLVEYLAGDGAGHIQSLILAAVLLISGFQTILFGIIADLISVNRRLHEESLVRLRKLELRPRFARKGRPAAPEAPAKTAGESIPDEGESQWVWIAGDEEEIEPVRGSRPRRRRRGRSGGEHRVTDPRDRKHQPRLHNDDD
ncbi:MAG: glycosyltransferase family 2 protein [Acidobacteria bacterium]|nr:glycosyltransferase family 2 protein [Acidobacteriota bacterium]